jgi:DNA polymerase III gamma/tau subunit
MLNTEAVNAFKNASGATPHVVFILRLRITKIASYIISRCTVINFKRLGMKKCGDTYKILESKKLNIKR